MLPTNNISTNYEARGRRGGGVEGWHFHRSYLRQKCAAWIEIGGGLFDFLGGVGRLGQSKNYFHRWEKSRSGALFTIYRGQFSVFALSAAGIFQSLTPLTPPRKILKSNDSPHKHTNFN